MKLIILFLILVSCAKAPIISNPVKVIDTTEIKGDIEKIYVETDPVIKTIYKDKIVKEIEYIEKENYNLVTEFNKLQGLEYQCQLDKAEIQGKYVTTRNLLVLIIALLVGMELLIMIIGKKNGIFSK
jgi:hypothetical protein